LWPGEQEKIAQAEQKMPSGRVRCELWEGFRAVRELQDDESRRAGRGEHVIYFAPRSSCRIAVSKRATIPRGSSVGGRSF